jgi:gluconolactonase
MAPDVITIDPSFDALLVLTNGIKRLWTGGIWLEGPAWSSQGRYLVFSDISNNRQLRWLEDDGRVGVFRSPYNHSNGKHVRFPEPSDFLRALGLCFGVQF